MKSNPHSLLVLLVFLMVTALSCEKPELSVHEGGPSVATAPQEDEPGCDQAGDRYSFSMGVATSGQPEAQGLPSHMTYKVYIYPSIPFRLEDNCECLVKSMEFVFDYLPPVGQFSITDENHVDVNYIGPYTTPFGTAIKIANASMDDVYYVGFDEEVTPTPQLKLQGGFCIIDNVSGPIVLPPPYVAAVSLDVFDTRTGNLVTQVWLSMSMLDGPAP